MESSRSISSRLAARRVYLDHGWIKIAERAGFIAPHVDDEHGVVSHIMLAGTV